MYFEKLTRKRDTLIQSIRMSESQPEIFNEVSNSREENIQAGISSLRRFRDNMERNNLKLPKYSMVLTSHGNCYRADDNIYIVPINCLKD